MEYFVLENLTSFYVATIVTIPQYTEGLLDKLLKREFIPIVLLLEEHNRTLQNRMSEVNNEVAEEMCRFYENFSKLHSELSVTKRVNTKLAKRIAKLERQCWVNAPYSIRVPSPSR